MPDRTNQQNPHRRRFRVSGRVQGVGFRDWTARRARELGLRGWVCNLASGEVEVEAAGAADALERLRELLQRGPGLAQVRALTELPPGAAALPDNFVVSFAPRDPR